MIINKIRSILQKMLGYSVVISCKHGPSKGDDVFSKCWLYSDCSVRANWNGKQVILMQGGVVRGLPTSWNATWIKCKE